MKKENKKQLSLCSSILISPFFQDFSSSSCSFFHFIPPFFLQSFSNVYSCLFAYYSSTSSNSSLTFSNIHLQNFYHPIHIIILPYTSLVILFSDTLPLLYSFLLPSSILFLLLLFLQSHLPNPLYSLSPSFFPIYHFLL